MMSKVRYAVVGSGWRSLFYIRIAKALPEIFELTALLCRSREKADHFRKEYGIRAVTDDREVMDSDPDFIVSAVSENSIAETAAKWTSRGFPVLSETPAGLSLEQLKMLWDLYENSGCRIQIAEQYQFYPRYSSIIRLVQSGILGEPVSLDISAMHGCHAASMIRCLLGTGLEEARITGRTFSLPVTETRTRYEVLTSGTVSKKEQLHAVLEFESGKPVFYDFLSEQYRSPIRNRVLRLRGTRGELLNDMVYYLDENNHPLQAPLAVKSDPSTGEILSVSLRGQVLYSPVFGVCGLPEDETAIAGMLVGMKEYVNGGREVYPFSSALEDAYLALLMSGPGSGSDWFQVRTGPRPWKYPGLKPYSDPSTQTEPSIKH